MAAKILIVDDEVVDRKMIKKILDSNGHSCTLAANAKEARKCLEKQKFELVLCDMKMPGESGLDFIRGTLPRYKDTVAAMVTAVDDFLVAETALDMGIYDYVIKPFNRNSLLISVANALRRRELEISNRTHRENLEKMVSAASTSIEMLQKVTTAVHSSLDLEKVYKEITNGVVHNLGYTTAFILELSDDEKYFEVKTFSTKKGLLKQINKILGSALRNFSLPADPELNPNIRSVIEGKIVVVRTLEEIAYPVVSKKRCSTLQQVAKTKNYIIAPLMSEKDMVGALFISNSREEISGEELKIIESFTHAASSAIINANLNMQTEKAWKELRENEERLKILFESAPDAYYLSDLKGNFVDGNIAAEKMIGYKREELVGKNMLKLNLLPPKQVPKAAANLAKNALGYATGPDEFILKRKDGGPITVEIITHPVKVKNRTLVLGIGRDVTARKKADETLKESEERYRNLIEGTHDMIQSVDLDGSFMFVNQAWLKTMGYDEDELSDLNMFDIIHPEYLPHCKEMFSKIMTGESLKNAEAIFVTKDGREIFVEGNASPRYLGNKVVGTQGFFHDITERKQAEQDLRKAYSQLQETQAQLIQAEKMEVVGRLASGVAHEVKNPLAIILQGVDYLTKKVDTEDKNIHSTLSFIKDATHRADKVIKGLLDFSSISKLDIRSENLNSIIESTILLMKHYLNENKIQLIKDFDEKIPEVKVDKNRVEQVFINISMNAAQAMPNGGTLIFRTYTKNLSQSDKGVGRRKEDAYKLGETVLLAEVEDTGSGIPEEYLNKIFDPFFTTRRGKGGTGLGLPAVRNIMELHEGQIEIQNKKSGGTKATLMFKIDE